MAELQLRNRGTKRATVLRCHQRHSAGMVPRFRNCNSAMGSHCRSALVRPAGKEFIGAGNRTSGKIGCARPREMLVAKISGAAASQSAEDTDFGCDRRSVLS